MPTPEEALADRERIFALIQERLPIWYFSRILEGADEPQFPVGFACIYPDRTYRLINSEACCPTAFQVRNKLLDLAVLDWQLEQEQPVVDYWNQFPEPIHEGVLELCRTQAREYGIPLVFIMLAVTQDGALPVSVLFRPIEIPSVVALEMIQSAVRKMIIRDT